MFDAIGEGHKIMHEGVKKEALMNDFNFHGKQAKNLLTNRKYLSTDCRQALHIIVRLCDKGQKLEAENADLRNELKAALERC